MKIFISGSIKINKLPQKALMKLENIMAQNFTVLVGDAQGIDLNVQQYLLKKAYKNVNVYYAGNKVRNNIGNWQTKNVLPQNNETGRSLYTLKDVLMARDADFGLMIWDGKSQGTLNNVKQMKKLNKKFYVITNDTLITDCQFNAPIAPQSQISLL